MTISVGDKIPDVTIKTNGAKGPEDSSPVPSPAGHTGAAQGRQSRRRTSGLSSMD